MKTKYPIELLKRTFNMVIDQVNWKEKIDYWIRKRDHDLVEESIRFYTATEMEVVESTDSYERIVSIGYRAGPAGDH